MSNQTFALHLSIFAFLALASTILVFESTTFTGQTGVNFERSQLSRERLLAREPCNYVEAELGFTDDAGCERLGRLECEKAKGIKRTNTGDAYDYTKLNCLNQCIRDIAAQCEHTSSAFNQEGRR